MFVIKFMNKLSSISFFCPAYHDENNLPVLIPRVHEFLSEIASIFEIIIIEDGSPDKTGEVADRLANQYSYVRVVHHPKNTGYGATLRDGFKSARYDYVIYTDGDNQYDIRDIGPYLRLLSEADVLSGYAVKKAVTLKRKIQSLVFNLLVNFLFLVDLRDINCSLKVYKRQVLSVISMRSNGAFIDAEMLVGAKRAGFKIVQFPVIHYERKSGVASGAKVSVIADTIKDMLKFRLNLND